MTLKRIRVMAACTGLFVLSATLLLAADEAIDPAGRPKQLEKGKHTAFAVWEDGGVWQIRTSVKPGANGKMQRVSFTGTVTVKGDKVTNGEFQGLEKKPVAAAKDTNYGRQGREGVRLPVQHDQHQRRWRQLQTRPQSGIRDVPAAELATTTRRKS